jgi:STE24 endopeptidase
MQIGYINKAKYGKPFLLDGEAFVKAGNYSVEKEKLGIKSAVVEYGLFIFWFHSGFVWLDSLLLDQSGLVKTILFVQLFILINYVVMLPFDIYEKFVIDAKYEFNKATPKIFMTDMIKSGALLLIFGSLVIMGVYYLIVSFDQWWLWSFVFIFGIILFINMIYPTLIAPIFNKMSLLEDESLKDKIENLLDTVGFKSSGVYVVDASTRDSRLNAYFGGFGKTKRVVLFDTLIEKLQDVELLAVLGHELGHFKHGDVYKNIVMMGTMMFLMFFIFGNLPQDLFLEIGVSHSPAMLMVLFMLFMSVLSFILMPVIGMVSRHNEFAADEMGSELSSPLHLAEALKKLVTENRSFPFSHPIYIFFYYTHPPVAERLKALGVDVQTGSDEALRDDEFKG